VSSHRLVVDGLEVRPLQDFIRARLLTHVVQQLKGYDTAAGPESVRLAHCVPQREMRFGAQRLQADLVRPQQSAPQSQGRACALSWLWIIACQVNLALTACWHALFVGLLHQSTQAGDGSLRLPSCRLISAVVHFGGKNHRLSAPVASCKAWS
jgi:hypothetical protein